MSAITDLIGGPVKIGSVEPIGETVIPKSEVDAASRELMRPIDPDSAKITEAIEHARLTLSDLPTTTAKVGALAVMEADELIPAIQARDWAKVGEMATKYGLELNGNDIWVLSEMGSAAGELAAASARFVRDLPGIISSNADDDSASESMVLSFIREFVELVDEGVISNESFNTLLGIAIPEAKDAIISAAKGNVDKAATLLTDVLLSKLAIGGGRSGYDPKVSWLLSVLYSILPQNGRDALKYALSAAVATKTALDNKLLYVSDSIGVIIEALLGENMPTATLPDSADINGVKWWVVPFSSGYIGISDTPVQGPDIRVFWNKWNPATKQALKLADAIPVIGDTIVDVVNGVAQYNAYQQFVDLLRKTDSSPDTVLSILQTIAKYGITKAIDMGKVWAERAMSALLEKAREAGGKMSNSMANWFDAKVRKLRDAALDVVTIKREPKSDPVGVKTEVPSSAGMPPSTTSVSFASDGSLGEFVAPNKRLAAEAAEDDISEYEIEGWYPGSSPVSHGGRF